MTTEKSVSIATLLLGLAIISLLAVFVFWVLPRMTAPASQDISPGTSPSAQSAALSNHQPAASVKDDKVQAPAASGDRTQAEAALAKFLSLQSSLRKKSAELWAESDWKTALKQAANGDEAFADEQYDQAEIHFSAATDILIKVQKQMPAVLQQQLQSGDQALENGQGEQAQVFFETALKIDADNHQAKRGLQRRAVMDEVAGHLVSGDRYTEQGIQALAMLEYQQAFDLDKDSKAAREKLQQAQARLADEHFHRLMSEALLAVSHKKYKTALDLFSQAHDIEPDNVQVSDGIA
ncbi:MAG: hypothetical protein KZQ58_09660 [gamma proteobacterium symbiont of Bathyaustriella thionipta]|nr:hypothetical protein [gamma proteobacterium symbiont of Bathyaustriella thionipta]